LRSWERELNYNSPQDAECVEGGWVMRREERLS